MLYSTLVVAASAFAGLASAQNSTFNTPIPCCSVPATQVNSTLKASWCEANTNTCNDLCGGPGQLASNGNDCDETTLQYTCKCSNGTDAQQSIGAYQQSVPAQMCNFWFSQCIDASGSNRNAREQCEQAQKSQCGNLTIDAAGAISTASASGSGASASRTPTGSASGGAASSTTAAGAAATLAQFGAPVLAGGLMAVFGLAL